MLLRGVRLRYQQLNNADVGFRELVFTQIGLFYPAHRLPFTAKRLARPTLHQIKIQCHDAIAETMLHHLQQFGTFGFDTGLFTQLAAQGLFRRLTRFDLAAGKLPKSGHVRVSGAGGCCSFDLPTLHMWMHAPQQDRDADVAAWLQSLDPLNQALIMVLDLIRQSGPFRNQISLNGFFQDNAEGADLLRLRLHLAPQLYPQISGHKTRYAIRFLPLDSENGVVPERLTFELACC